MRESEPWHIDKKVSIGHLFTTATIAASAIYYIQKQDVRIELLEQRLNIEIARAEKVDNELSKRIEQNRTESRSERKELAQALRTQLEKINDKLDKLVEGARR